MTTDVKPPKAAEPAPRSLEPESPFISGIRGSDGNWIPVPTLADGNATWLPEAPTDGVIYGRRGSDETWRPLTVTVNETLEGDGDGLTAPLGVAWATADAPGILSVPDDSALTLVQVATIPPARAVNMTLGLETATAADVLAGVDDIHPITPAALAEALTGGWDVLDDRFVNVDGDTMTGDLTVETDLHIEGHGFAPLAPTDDDHVVNKRYVDTRVTGTLTLIGTFNASTGQVTFSYASGVPNGPLPPAGPDNENQYVIVAVAGTPPIGPPETQIICQVGDWWVSDGTEWLYLPIGGDVIAARNVALIPSAFGEDNVQDAMEAAEAEVTQNAADIADLEADLAAGLALKVDRAGDTMGGLLTLAVDPVDDMDAATKRYVDEAVAVPVPVRVPIGPTPPPGAQPGALWWRDDPDGDFYILYNDGSSVQWVSTTKPGLGGGGGTTPPPFDDSHLLRLDGGTVTGELLVTGPTTAPQSVVTRDWVETITSGALYQGGWRVSTNVPPLPAAPRHGDRYLCLTAVADVPETPPGNIPGLAGRQINNGAYIIWDDPSGLWQLIQFNLGGGLTTDTADLRYLRLSGGTLTGPLALSGAPTADLHAATKAYVDSRVLNEAGVGPWTGVTNGAQWTGTNVQCRLINGGANIQVRGKVSFNNQQFNGAGFQAFQLPTTHVPGGIGGAVCPATDSQTETTVLRSAMSFNWVTGDRWIYASRTYVTTASPRIADVSLIIPRT